MFHGNYNFFDYKYNIPNYTGQDFGGFPQYLYLIISIILLIILLYIFRNSNKNKVLKIIRFVGVFMILFYIIKTTWESIYDIKLTGSFNTGLLPFDTCSMIMLSCIISGFTKGKLKKYADSWIATGGVVGGIATMIYLNAFKYYPFLSFGAFYSMIWHFLMVFLGLLLFITDYVDSNYNTVINGFIFHILVSCFIIPIDFIYNYDFMLYLNLGGIPFFENIASTLTSMNLKILNPIIMLILYFLSFNLIYFLNIIPKKILKK